MIWGHFYKYNWWYEVFEIYFKFIHIWILYFNFNIYKLLNNKCKMFKTLKNILFTIRHKENRNTIDSG